MLREVKMLGDSGIRKKRVNSSFLGRRLVLKWSI